MSRATKILEIPRPLTKKRSKERDRLQILIQKHFGVMEARFFMEDPRRAEKHIKDSTCRTGMNSEQQKVFKRLQAF